MCETLPFMDDIVAGARIPMPTELHQRLQARYQKHGTAYASPTLQDGVPINQCMYADNLQDAEEEVVDAVFNMLVFQLRNSTEPFSGSQVTQHLVQCWEQLQQLRAMSAS